MPQDSEVIACALRLMLEGHSKLLKVHQSALKHLTLALAYEATHRRGNISENEKWTIFATELGAACDTVFKNHLNVAEYNCPDWFKDAAKYTDVNKTKVFEPNGKTCTQWNAGGLSRRELKNAFLPVVTDSLKVKGYKRADDSFCIPSGKQLLEFVAYVNDASFFIGRNRKGADNAGK
jgi:hypothetical protein